MLSMIEVKCPHCGAQGQIMLPPLGSLIVGPCPQCEEFVAVFCGRVLALDKELMTNGSAVERKEHLLGALIGFLEERVERLIENQDNADSEGGGEDMAVSGDSADTEPRPSTPPTSDPGDRAISDDEMAAFVQQSLKQLDDKAYFKAIFG